MGITVSVDLMEVWPWTRRIRRRLQNPPQSTSKVIQALLTIYWKQIWLYTVVCVVVHNSHVAKRDSMVYVHTSLTMLYQH